MANGLGSLQVFNPQSVFPRGFSIGMDPRPFLAQSGLQIQGNRVVPIPGFSQPTAPAPQPVAPPTPQPVAPPTPQPTPPPMIPQPQPALPSEQLNIQPPMGIPTTPPVQEPPPMAPPVMEQPPMAPPMTPPMEQPVMEQPAMGGFFNKVFNTLRGENVTNLDQPVTSTPQLDDFEPLPPPIARPRIDNRFFRPVGTPPEFTFGLDGILGRFDRFRPPPPPRFGLPVGFRPARRFFPPGFGESPMRNFREMRGIGLRNPFFGPRRQG